MRDHSLETETLALQRVISRKVRQEPFITKRPARTTVFIIADGFDIYCNDSTALLTTGDICGILVKKPDTIKETAL